MSKRKPYVGVTGVTTLDDARAVAAAFARNFSQMANQSGMVGFLVSYETLNGEAGSNSRYPLFADLPNLLCATRSSAINAIHYRPNRQAGFERQIVDLFRSADIYADGLCRTIQLNFRWPDPQSLGHIRRELDALDIILCITGRIMRRMPLDEIRRRVSAYAGLVDYLLIDPSGGFGTSFTVPQIEPFFHLARKVLSDLPIVLAGGFDDENVVPRLRDIAETLQTREFGIDAESGLRAGPGRRSDTTFSAEKAARYATRAAGFFAASGGADNPSPSVAAES